MKQTKPKSKKRVRNNSTSKKEKKGALGGGYGLRSQRGPVPLKTNQADTSATFNPNKLWETRKASSPGGMRVVGQELLAQADRIITGNSYDPVSFTTYPITSHLNGPINGVAVHPIWFPRLSALSGIYEFYKFHKLVFKFTTLLPFTTAGNAVFYLEPQTDANAATNIQTAASQLTSVLGPIYSDMVLELPQDMTYKNGNSRYKCYYPRDTHWNDPTGALASADILQTVQAILYGGLMTGSLDAGTICYTIVAEYDVEFYVPQLNRAGLQDVVYGGQINSNMSVEDAIIRKSLRDSAIQKIKEGEEKSQLGNTVDGELKTRCQCPGCCFSKTG